MKKKSAIQHNRSTVYADHHWQSWSRLLLLLKAHAEFKITPTQKAGEQRGNLESVECSVSVGEWSNTILTQRAHLSLYLNQQPSFSKPSHVHLRILIRLFIEFRIRIRLLKSSGSGFGSNPKYLLCLQNYDFKGHSRASSNICTFQRILKFSIF
jgi:hypothetical protein